MKLKTRSFCDSCGYPLAWSDYHQRHICRQIRCVKKRDNDAEVFTPAWGN